MRLFLQVGLLAALAAATLSAQDISGPLSHVQQPFDVLHYDAEIDLTKAPSVQMVGTVAITLRWVPEFSGARYFAFHLRDLSITEVRYNGQVTTFTTIGDPTSPTYHHRVVPTTAPQDGDTAVVVVVYRGNMTDELGPGFWGGVGTSDSTLYAMGVGFANNYVSTTQHWLASYDHPSDKATFRGRFRTLDGFITASNGLVTTSLVGDTMVSEWTTTIPTATYLLTFATSTYVRLDFGQDPVPMVVYSRTRDSAATRRSFMHLPRMVRTFASRFIPYPFEKVGYVNTPIGAMEHQTMVSFPTSISRSRDTVNSVAAHELAHQWFGDLVSPADFRHAWLTEAFATFSESLWAEELGGSPAYLRSLGQALNSYLGRVYNAEGVLPLYDFPRASPSSNYPETIYLKGAVVVGMLRTHMGDSAFFGALRDYLTTYGYSIATTEQLKEVLERHAGEELDWFFEQWVYGRGWPTLAMRFDRTPIGNGLNRVVIDAAQTSQGDVALYRRLPIELSFINAGRASLRVITLDSASQRFVVDSVPDYTTVGINRGATMVTLLRVNSVSGVESIAANADSAVSFAVRPNPSDGSQALSVKVNGVSDCANLRYELYDSSGQRLGTGSSEYCEFTIPTDGLSSGGYVLRFRFRNLFHDVSIVIAR